MLKEIFFVLFGAGVLVSNCFSNDFDPYSDLVASDSTYFCEPKLADKYISSALVLDKQNKGLDALATLKSGVENTNFCNVKIRYFLAKQYVSVMQDKELQTKNNANNLANHLLFVKEFLASSEASKEDIEYYSAGLNDLLSKSKDFGIGEWFPELKNSARIAYSTMYKAAQRAFYENPRTPSACYRTSVRTAHLAGATGNGYTWATSSKRRNQSMAKLKEAISNNELLPGMVIYVNYNPGTDPSSTNLSNGPHWFTYLGKDKNNIDRFSDQYSDNATLEYMMDFVPGRLIDEILDPHAK